MSSISGNAAPEIHFLRGCGRGIQYLHLTLTGDTKPRQQSTQNREALVASAPQSGCDLVTVRRLMI